MAAGERRSLGSELTCRTLLQSLSSMAVNLGAAQRWPNDRHMLCIGEFA